MMRREDDVDMWKVRCGHLLSFGLHLDKCPQTTQDMYESILEQDALMIETRLD